MLIVSTDRFWLPGSSATIADLGQFTAVPRYCRDGTKDLEHPCITVLCRLNPIRVGRLGACFTILTLTLRPDFLKPLGNPLLEAPVSRRIEHGPPQAIGETLHSIDGVRE